jgi:hypothetical protein
MNGWFLLYKKIWDNPRFYKNSKAIAILVWLFSHCNEKGIVTCGRQQIAIDCGISESSVYRVVTNLSKIYQGNEPIVNIKTNNHFSTITILKWAELQRPVNNGLNNKRTTSEQPANNHRTLINNKEEIIKNKELDTEQLLKLQEKFPTKSVKQEYEKCKDWILANGKTYKDYEAMFKNWLRRSADTRTPSVPKENLVINQENLDLLNKGKLCIPN